MSTGLPSGLSPGEKQPSFEARIAVRNTTDPHHVDEAGAPFYTHLRSAEAIVDFRVRALSRAYAQYTTTRDGAAPEPEVAGRGLLVLQRAFLMVEDLGGLMYAVLGTDPWSRLTSYYSPQLDEVFGSVLDGRQDVGEILLLPTDEQLAASAKLSDQRTSAIARNLRDLTLAEVEPLFQFAATFWLAHHDAAKSTMHGFGVVAAEHLIAPPGGGELSEIVPIDGPRPFAIALVTREAQRTAETTYHPLDLTPGNVEMVQSTGLAAGELYRLVARAHRGTIRRGHSWTLPDAYAQKLSAADQQILREAARE